jgi:hypothetical protein
LAIVGSRQDMSQRCSTSLLASCLDNVVFYSSGANANRAAGEFGYSNVSLLTWCKGKRSGKVPVQFVRPAQSPAAATVKQ